MASPTPSATHVAAAPVPDRTGPPGHDHVGQQQIDRLRFTARDVRPFPAPHALHCEPPPHPQPTGCVGGRECGPRWQSIHYLESRSLHLATTSLFLAASPISACIWPFAGRSTSPATCEFAMGKKSEIKTLGSHPDLGSIPI